MDFADRMADSRRLWLGGLLCVLLVVALAWWFRPRPPAVEFDNLRYIQLLSTSISAENADWLAKVESAVRVRHEAGEMSPRELQHFQQIIDLAKAGDWQTANRECYAFAEAQLNRRRSRPASDVHAGHQH